MSEREILFRGKRVDNGEWVEGLPIKTYDTEIGKNSVDYSNPVPVVLMASGRIVLECGYDEIPFFNIDEYPIVNPETISQYVGLTDKNGTRIFERDIVRHKDTLHEVIFCKINGCAFFGITMPDRGEIWNFDGITRADRMEVIGNIHDNPELLKGE